MKNSRYPVYSYCKLARPGGIFSYQLSAFQNLPRYSEIGFIMTFRPSYINADRYSSSSREKSVFNLHMDCFSLSSYYRKPTIILRSYRITLCSKYFILHWLFVRLQKTVVPHHQIVKVVLYIQEVLTHFI